MNEWPKPLADDYAPLRLALRGEAIDQKGVNIHEFGRVLLSFQGVINSTAAFLVQRAEAPRSPDWYHRRPFFLQSHLVHAKPGSLDLLLALAPQPELYTILSNAGVVRDFGVSVLANFFSSAVLMTRSGSRDSNSKKPDYRLHHGEDFFTRDEQALAKVIVPEMVRLSRCIDKRGGIERLEFDAEHSRESSRMSLVIDAGARNQILNFAERSPPERMRLNGEIRSVYLDLGRATLVEAYGCEIYELELPLSEKEARKFLGEKVEVDGNVRTGFDHRGRPKRYMEVKDVRRRRW